MSFTIVDTGFRSGRFAFDGQEFGPWDVDGFDLASLGMMTDTMGSGDGDVPDSVGGEDGDVPDSVGGGDDEDESQDDDTESERM
jgi:hypothetical protein